MGCSGADYFRVVEVFEELVFGVERVRQHGLEATGREDVIKGSLLEVGGWGRFIHRL
jgi:hypothetical protein